MAVPGGSEAGRETDVRCQLEKHPVGSVRRDILLGDQLDAVGQRLQPAKLATHAGGAKSILDATRDFSFQPDKDQRTDGDDVQQQNAVNQRGDDISKCRVLQSHDAIDEFCHDCFPLPVSL